MVKFNIIELANYAKKPQNTGIARRAILVVFPWLIAFGLVFTLRGDAALCGLVVALLCLPLSFVV